jgi:hypothetical protein
MLSLRFAVLVLGFGFATLSACAKEEETVAGDAGSGDMSGGSTETEDTSTSETTVDSNDTGPIIQDACCSCSEGMLGGCEPWDEGDECEGVVKMDCELVGNQLLCGDAC